MEPQRLPLWWPSFVQRYKGILTTFTEKDCNALQKEIQEGAQKSEESGCRK